MQNTDGSPFRLDEDAAAGWKAGESEAGPWTCVLTGDTAQLDRELWQILEAGLHAGVATRAVVGGGPGKDVSVADLERVVAARTCLYQSGRGAAPVLWVLVDARELFEVDPEGWRRALEKCPDGHVAVLTLVNDVDVANFAGSEELMAVCIRGGVLDLRTRK